MDLPNWNIQLQWLFTLAIPIASISWTVTHEEIFKEPREYCVTKSKKAKSLLSRKFFYLFTCEYCFSHYISIAFLCLSDFKLLFNDWRGYIIAGFALVWIANLYMSIYSLIRFGIKKEKVDISIKEGQLKSKPG